MDQQLCLLSRDEVIAWLNARGRLVQIDSQFRLAVMAHIDNIVKRAENVACKLERDNVRSLLRLRTSLTQLLIGNWSQWKQHDPARCADGHESDIDRDKSASIGEDG